MENSQCQTHFTSEINLFAVQRLKVFLKFSIPISRRKLNQSQIPKLNLFSRVATHYDDTNNQQLLQQLIQLIHSYENEAFFQFAYAND